MRRGYYISVRVGEVHGSHTVLEELPESTNPSLEGSRRRNFRCRCVCGNVADLTYSALDYSRRKGPLSSGCTVCKGDKYRRRPGKTTQDDVGGIPGPQILSIQTGARVRGIAFNISWDDLWALFQSQDGKCALSGVPIEFGRRLRRRNIRYPDTTTASLDRIDSKKPYEKGNVQWVHKDVNIMKQDYGQEYFIKFCTLIAEKQSG